MSGAHTPGPWAIGEADWSERGFARYELEGVREISALDARLIAATPDLLDGLQFAIRNHDNLTPSDVARMQAIVDRATGAAT